MRLFAVFFLFLPPLFSGRLVLRNGQSFLFPGAFEVKGDRICFHDERGQELSLPLRLADLTRSDANLVVEAKFEVLFSAEPILPDKERQQVPEIWPEAPDYAIEIRHLPVLLPPKPKKPPEVDLPALANDASTESSGLKADPSPRKTSKKPPKKTQKAPANPNSLPTQR